MAATNKTFATKGPSTADQNLINLFQTIQTNQIDQALTSGGLAISGAGSPLAKTASVVYALCNGILQKVAAANLPALSGTVTNAQFNVFCFYVNSAGTLSTLMGTAGATIGAVAFPTTPANAAMIGFVIINPTGTGNFVGGTTNLDDATVVPNAVYINTVGDFNPNILTM